jgi:hypothetical protein
MTLETKLTTILKAICPRTFTDFAEAGTARPYVTFQQIGGDNIKPLSGGVASKENAVVQINVWADSRAEARAMMNAIEVAAVASAIFQCSAVAALQSDFDSDMKRYCSRQDFSIWFDR